MAKKTEKKTPKHLSSWNMFVMKVKAENPNLAFKDVLKLAGKMKKVEQTQKPMLLKKAEMQKRR